MRTSISVFALITSLLLAPLLAAQTTGPREIEAAASGFLRAFAEELKDKEYQVSYKVGTVSSRLRLAHCDEKLTVAFSGDPWTTTHPTLAISCEGKRPWRIFLSSELNILGDALVASRALGRGDRITVDMIDTRAMVLNSARETLIFSADDLLGMEMRRPVNSGTLFSAALLRSPDAVARGDHVVITATSGVFSVTARGVALRSGAVGEQVLVENLTSSRTVKALITAPGQVRIPM